MVVEPIKDNKIKIKLSNTESVTQNIYKYTSLEEIKETKSTSSTCSYFLTTKKELGEELIKKFNNSSKYFACDVKRTLLCFEEMNKLIEQKSIKEKFRGSLSPFYESLNLFRNFTMDELVIGNSSAKFDSNERYNLYFDNDNRNAAIFRNGIISVLCDLVIEERENSYLIYPVLKEALIAKEDDIENLKKDLMLLMEVINNDNNDELTKDVQLLIQKAYKLYTRIESSKK